MNGHVLALKELFEARVISWPRRPSTRSAREALKWLKNQEAKTR